MYTIEVKDNSKEKVYVVCPSLISAKEWIYTMLLRAMREDVAMNTTLAEMRDITAHYYSQMVSLELFEDTNQITTIADTFTTYHDTRYVVKYNPDECLKTVNVI